MTSLEVMMKNAGSNMRKQRRAKKVFKARQQRALVANRKRATRRERMVVLSRPAKLSTKSHPAKRRRASRSSA